MEFNNVVDTLKSSVGMALRGGAKTKRPRGLSDLKGWNPMGEWKARRCGYEKASLIQKERILRGQRRGLKKGGNLWGDELDWGNGQKRLEKRWA